MDDWYLQASPQNQVTGTSLNPLFDQLNYQGRIITSLDDSWEVQAIADDFEKE